MVGLWIVRVLTWLNPLLPVFGYMVRTLWGPMGPHGATKVLISGLGIVVFLLWWWGIAVVLDKLAARRRVSGAA